MAGLAVAPNPLAPPSGACGGPSPVAHSVSAAPPDNRHGSTWYGARRAVFGDFMAAVFAPEGDGAWLSSTHYLIMLERYPNLQALLQHAAVTAWDGVRTHEDAPAEPRAYMGLAA